MAKRKSISVSRVLYDRLRAASASSGVSMSRIVEATLAGDLEVSAPRPPPPDHFEWRGVVRAWSEPIPGEPQPKRPRRARPAAEVRTMTIRGETRVDRALREARREVKRAGVSGDGHAYGGTGHGSRARFDRAVSDAFCRRLRELGIAVEE